MKTMKILVVSLLLGLVGLVGKAKADGYFTTQSTGVFIATGTNIEITSIQIGSGSANAGGSVWAVLVDSIPLSSIGTTPGNLLPSEVFSLARFPASQYIAPPLIAYTTNTVSYPITALNFVDAQGNGRGIEKGLSLFIVNNANNGTNPGVTVTVGYKKKTSGGKPR